LFGQVSAAINVSWRERSAACLSYASISKWNVAISKFEGKLSISTVLRYRYSMGTVTKIADLEGIVESIKNNSTTTTSSLAIGKSNGVVVERMIEIATHELLHVLGLTSDSLPFFRNPVTGKPLTPRPFRVTETTCSNGETKAVLGEPSALVVGRVVDTITGLSHFEVRTPLVTQVVRNHFNCPSLTGARLENNPTSTDCFGSHWEERLHYSELMSAYLSTAYNYAVSPLTLAFLEDTSWYRANYQSEYVQSSAFGHLAGCDFVNEPCIVNGEVPNYGIGNFCSNTLETTEQGFVVRQAFPQTCDPTYKYKAHCDLRNARAGDVISEISRRYFPDGRVKIPNEFTHAAFCPIPSLQPTSCQNPEDQFIVSREYADAGEKNGPNSICVDVNRDRAICLQSFCNPGISRLQIQVLYGLNVTCMFDGQIHTLLGSSGSPNGLPFQITCPKLSQVCPDIICPDNCSGRGQCNYDEETGTGHCKCFDSNDNTTGCYTSSLKSVFSELSVSSVNGLSNEANLGMFLFVVSGVVLGLVGLHIWQRFRTDHFRREEKEEASAQKTDLFRDEEVESPRGSVESFHRYREKFNPIGDSGLEGSY
jgi:hypothetical protein